MVQVIIKKKPGVLSGVYREYLFLLALFFREWSAPMPKRYAKKDQ